jgi:hypothetical protein
MKAFNILLWCLSVALAFYVCCSCSADGTNTSTQIKSKAPVTSSVEQINNGQPGAWHTFTNVNVVMWVPANASEVWDGPTSLVKIDRITLPHVLPEEYKIEIVIRTDSEQEFKQNADMSQDWHFQEHPTLSMKDVEVGKQLIKDIRDPEHDRILMFIGTVVKTDTFDKDVATAKKMIESIKLVAK